MNLWDLLEEKQEEDNKTTDIRKDEADEVKESLETKEIKETKVDKKQNKKETTKKKSEKKKESQKAGYTYPFGLYTEGRMVDISSYGFEDGQTYDDKEITKIMLNHRHYEFSGDIEYNFIQEDNVLVANLKQHKKG